MRGVGGPCIDIPGCEGCKGRNAVSRSLASAEALPTVTPLLRALYQKFAVFSG